MNIRFLSEKIAEEIAIEGEMAEKYRKAAQLTDDPIARETFGQMVIDEQKHSVITEEILAILKKYQ